VLTCAKVCPARLVAVVAFVALVALSALCADGTFGNRETFT
jgi:hypothetical protein